MLKNIYRIPAYDLIMCRYFRIGFIDFTLKSKSLLDYTNLFSPKEYEKNDKAISKKVKMKNRYRIICGKYRKFKNPKISYTFEETLVLSIICSKCKNEDEKIFKEEESIKILKILSLIENTQLL